MFVVLLSSLQFNPPKSRLNTVFFKGKPTLRLVSDICTFTPQRNCVRASEKKWHVTGILSKEIPEFLRGHRRFYNTVLLSSQCKRRSSLCDNSFKKNLCTFVCQVTSQHPYCEEFIGAPHVYTIDVNVLSDVEKAIKEILLKEVF